MSYILDALKKAERERKLGNVPSIDATLDGFTGSSRGSRWPTIIAAGLIANAAVLGALYLYWQQRPEKPMEQARSITRTESLPSRERTALPATREDREPSPAPSGSETASVEAPQALVADIGPASTLPSPEPVIEQQPTQSPPASEPPTTAATSELPLPPLLEDLPAEFRLDVPPLELTVHVYSDTPSQRFIFVNNRRYGEGQDTQEGARVERIQPNGIVLSYRGREFFLPGRW